MWVNGRGWYRITNGSMYEQPCTFIYKQPCTLGGFRHDFLQNLLIPFWRMGDISTSAEEMCAVTNGMQVIQDYSIALKVTIFSRLQELSSAISKSYKQWEFHIQTILILYTLRMVEEEFRTQKIQQQQTRCILRLHHTSPCISPMHFSAMSGGPVILLLSVY